MILSVILIMIHQISYLFDSELSRVISTYCFQNLSWAGSTLVFSKIRAEPAQPDFLTRAKIVPTSLFSVFFKLGLSRLNPQRKLGLAWTRLVQLKKKWKKVGFFLNCPYGLWLTVSGARWLRGLPRTPGGVETRGLGFRSFLMFDWNNAGCSS